MSRDDFLSRWSRRKAASKTQALRASADVAPKEEIQAAPAEAPGAPRAGAVPESSRTPLPAIESLTPESDFAPFMQADVDPGVKRAALKTLLRDPRFNVMDGLDVYIDDYSKPDPIPPEWLSQLNQVKRLGSYIEPEPDAESEPEKTAETAPEAAPGELSPAIESPAALDTSDADRKTQQADNPPRIKE